MSGPGDVRTDEPHGDDGIPVVSDGQEPSVAANHQEEAGLSPTSPQEFAAAEGAFPNPSPERQIAEWEKLRELLFPHELALLRDLERRMGSADEQAQDLSRIIGDALLRLKGSEEKAKIKAALQDTVENIFTESAKRNPASLADHIFPVMGPAIKKAISENFLSMLQNFNKSLEFSFTLRGLKWRIEALRTGKPFSEIVLLHTLVYRVEQIFLIHAETGIVLTHLVNEGVESQDADLVSSMLTAVQDFVRDCFIKDQSDASSLDNMQLGDHTIFVERAPSVYLAYVVRGTPPITLREEFRDMLSVAVADCSDLLANFRGDTSGFSEVRRHFEKFLVSQYVDDGKKLPVAIRYLPAAVFLALLSLGIYGWWHLHDQEATFRKAVTALDSQAGIVVTEIAPSTFGKWRISFFRDDLAVDPTKILEEAGMPEGRFSLYGSPFISLDNEIVRQRVEKAIVPIDGVTLTFDENHILHFHGQANTGWIIAARERALATPGVKGVDVTNIHDPRMAALRILIDRIEKTSVRFLVGKEIPIPEDQQRLVDVVDSLAALEKLVAQMNIAVSLIIYGHADATGNEKVNYDISRKRADVVAAMLYARGSSMPLSLYGLGADYAARPEGKDSSDVDSRRIELHVKLTRAEDVKSDFFSQ